MSRVERFGRSNKRTGSHTPFITTESDKDVAEKAAKLPSRRDKYPSSGQKAAKWFYNMLFILFIGLVVFLFWYGNKFS